MDVCSEQESEHSNSNMESMSSGSRESPNSSPSQMVPQLAQVFRGITFANGAGVDVNNCGPFLRVTEQPTRYFRFRYKSEMVGTHGCILGRDSGQKQNKTHPTVELFNWNGKAKIRVRLAQAGRDEEHPHRLLEDDEDRDVVAAVPHEHNYRVAFPGMGIIHTAKKDVPGLLFTKFMKLLKDPTQQKIKEIHEHCETIAKDINLNIVRLMFSAHDVATDQLICQPVYSEPIHNMKSASTNDLKICRISRSSGRPRGGDDVYLLVEKVNKKNIKVRFYELDESFQEVWSAYGNFLQTDVHHQYAIVLRTPPYQDPHTARDVKVYIELQRPTDGRVSEPKEFVYKAEQVFKNKKRRINSSISSVCSGSVGSMNSPGDLPVTVTNMTQNNDADMNIPMYQIEIPQVPTALVDPSSNNLAEALLYEAGMGVHEPTLSPMLGQPNLNPMLGQPNLSPMLSQPNLSPMLGQPNVPEPPVIQVNSSDFLRLIEEDKDLTLEERNKFSQANLVEYMKLFNDSLNEKAFSESYNDRIDKSNSMDFIRSSMQLVADSSGDTKEIKEEPNEPTPIAMNVRRADKNKSEYNAHYKSEDGQEVKKLIKEICDLIKNKNGFKRQTVCSKIERLMELRLSNGDTFLHMTLSSNQPSFEYIVRLIHSMRLYHLLNTTNNQGQTIMHLAVENSLPDTVTMLVDYGCEVSSADRAGLTPLHYAVSRRSCLVALLAAFRRHRLPDEVLDVYNNEEQTPLHLAVMDNEAESARMLLEAGAWFTVRDREGRTPLHLATYDDYLEVTSALLQFIPPSEIDAVDGRGNTALQIVCGAGMRKNTLAIAKLLLDKKADPTAHIPGRASAWQLTREDALRSLLRPHVSHDHADVKSEPEEEFESPDEGEECNTALPS